MIPIFDSLTHPTLTGKWFATDKDASFQHVSTMVDSDEVIGFCAVGLAGVEAYEHQAFLEMLVTNKKCFAVAGIDLKKTNIADELIYIKSLGYRAIKLHPRLGCYNLDASHPALITCFEMAQALGLVIFLCTYSSSGLNTYPDKDPYWELVKLLKMFPETRCILLHGGVTNLLKYADLVRFNHNLLLDLSYTLIKFKGSSLDLDIQYLFANLDQCLCLGTDHPEYSLSELRHRLRDFEPYASHHKLSNIYYKNLQKFLEYNP